VKPENPNVDVFDRDAAAGGGYVYTSAGRLSCRLATGRSFDCIVGTGQLAGRSVLDMGCGDGHYTLLYWDRVKPKKLTGVDGAGAAIQVANQRKEQRPITFEVADVHKLPYPDNSFDLALVQSVLHHDDNPGDIIREAFRVAPVILIHEPNGNNPGLKLIEKTSRYHREHGEKSYSTGQLVRWIEQAGGVVQTRRYAGFVPMFCPDWMAKSMKAVEPLLESLPVLRALGCSVVVLVARRK
jgi:SAM-dependent methyltransferase